MDSHDAVRTPVLMMDRDGAVPSIAGDDGDDFPTSARRAVQWVGLFSGPVLAIVVYALLPETFRDAAGDQAVLGSAGRATAAVTVLMAVWWMTEAVEISATALLPIVLFPLVGATTLNEATEPYANPLIFLFLGGFLLALAMQRWGLERRIALLALRVVGTEPTRVIGGFMVMTAVFSMWVSNTATVAMMLPIALAVIAAVRVDRRPSRDDFSRALLLGIAASASIGGVGTLIGTPPNLFLASFARETLGTEISFVEWLGVGLPLVAVMLPVAWLLLTRVLFRPVIGDPSARASIADRLGSRLGRPHTAEWIVLVVFSLTVLAWLTRPVLEDLSILGARPFEHLSDAGIAMAAALSLFVIPADRRTMEPVLDWETAKRVPWGILLLFGGGLSLAAAIDANGLAEFIGAQTAVLDAVPPVVLITVIAAAVVFLSEMASNTATAAALVPILAAVAPGLGLEPLLLAVPAALAASMAFMLPVGTPPNAIVFGSGEIEMTDMMRLGVWLNLVSITTITVATYLVAAPLLGLDAPLW